MLLLGGGPLRQTLEEQAARLGIHERVSFAPQVPSTQMPEMYHQIDVLALPSLTRPNWKEQFGRVLVEAMCSGVPVIGSDSGAIPSVIGEAGVIVQEGDAAALAQVFSALREQPDEFARLARLGRQRAEANFTHRAVAAATVALYHDVLNN